MSRDDDFRVRPGRIRDRRPPQAKSFIARALAAAEKAGGLHPWSRYSAGSRFGRGRAASLAASRALMDRGGGAIVKARVVRHGARLAPLGAHLAYLQRDGVTRDGARGRVFDPAGDADLRSFTPALMGQAERNLGTRLDWVAIDHWNTEHPHIHVILRGRD
jgi:hypothetical protein